MSKLDNTNSLADKEAHQVTAVVAGKYQKYYVCRNCNQSYPSKAVMEASHTIIPIVTETVHK